MNSGKQNHYSQYEQHWIFWAMILVGGFFGAYTFSVRGGVFCNAQTANVTLLAMSLGTGDWLHALYLLLPISSYFSGAILSEYMNRRLSNNKRMQWGTTFVAFEILAVIVLGALPRSAPDQICQVALNFICSMQFNTFRKNEGTPMATIFVTNHIRETGSNLVKAIMDKDDDARRICKSHAAMIGMFILGGLISTILCRFLDVRAIWGAVPVLLYILIRLVRKTTSQD